MTSIRDWKRPLTAAELLEELENLEQDDVIPDGIVILPPDDGEESAEDSGDEECNDPDRLCSAQLNARAEFFYKNSNNIVEEPEFVDTYSLDGPVREEGPIPKKKTKVSAERSEAIKWKAAEDFPKSTKKEFMFPNPLTFSGSSHPLEFYELFITPNIVENLVRYTCMYAATKNKPGFELEVDDMYTFIGILLLSGYVPLPRRRMFWEDSEDVHNNLVSKSMRRNRFMEISSYLHAADNDNLPANDKLGKVRYLIDALNEKFIRYAPVQSNISIDESMIPYYGRHGCKQYIRGKPIRFGYKAWVAALKLGYCLQFQIYQGKDKNMDKVEGMGLGESVVFHFANILKTHYAEENLSLFFDNFFTSAKLIRLLGQAGFGATGTVRENRTAKCKLIETSQMKQLERGAMCSAVDSQNHIAGVRWKDNNIVTMLSNEFGIDPVVKCKRYSVKDKSKIDISQPNVVNKYNAFMGGVDQLDNHVANYRISFRGKKWYIPILFWLFDVSITNAWLLAREYGYTEDNLSFRRKVTQALLLKYGKKGLTPGPKRAYIRNPRIASGRHIILTQQNRRRCEVCKNKTTKSCEVCNVPLHDKCFQAYHQ